MPDDLEPQPAAPPLDACAGALHCPPKGRKHSILQFFHVSAVAYWLLAARLCAVLYALVFVWEVGGDRNVQKMDLGARSLQLSMKAESDLSFFFQMDPASWLNARYTYCLPNSYHGNYLLQLLFNTALDQSFLLILFLFLLQFNTVHSQGSALLPFSSADSLSE
ncbi:hypothetical protein U9M48_003185 [Paspalum notatum var. saurae]|uniref:Uncharacterized protein n=1 Tax=Paspalum notatum var. saurae TaxID=547442 RepID=A0AAQ3PI74_PASNO